MLAAFFILFTLVDPEPGPVPPNHRVAVVMSEARDEYRLALEGLREELNADIVEYNFEKNSDHISLIMADLNENKPDLIIAMGSSAYKIVKLRAVDIPIMFSMVAYPQEYCQENEEPFGISLKMSPRKDMEIVRDLFGPGIRVGLIYTPRLSQDYVTRQKAASKSLGIELVAVPVTSDKGSFQALDRLKDEVDLFFLLPDPAMADSKIFERLRLESLRQNKAIISFSQKFLAKDCLLSIGPDYVGIGQITGSTASNFLKANTRSGIIYPDAVQICVNRKVQKRMDLEIPEKIRLKAVFYD